MGVLCPGYCPSYPLRDPPSELSCVTRPVWSIVPPRLLSPAESILCLSGGIYVVTTGDRVQCVLAPDDTSWHTRGPGKSEGYGTTRHPAARIINITISIISAF